MRIVGGRFRGRSLREPKSQAIRPTSDRARESLFNIVTHAWPEALADTRILDLFAGTGALGLEALSRGARFALFIEESIEGRSLLRQNIEALGLTGSSKIFRRDATRLGERGSIEPFDLVFADPPFGKGLGEEAAAVAARNGWLIPGGLLVLEEHKNHTPDALAGYEKVDSRSAGIATISFFRRDDEFVR